MVMFIHPHFFFNDTKGTTYRYDFEFKFLGKLTGKEMYIIYRKCQSPSATYWECLRSGPPLLSFLIGHTRGSTLFVCAGDTAANVSCSKTFFLVNSVYTNNVLNACVYV